MYKNFKGGQVPENLEYIYFNGRGRGEGVRYLFAAGDIKYQDTRIPLGDKKWVEMKPTTPFGTLPVLKDGNETVGESIAIGKLAALWGGLAGDKPIKQAQIDAIVLKSTDFREGLATVMFMEGTEEQKAKAMEDFQTKSAKPIMDNLTRLLGKNTFFVDDKLSYADIWFYSCLELMILGLGKSGYLDPWPTLKELYKRVETSPKIAEYIKNRPETAF